MNIVAIDRDGRHAGVSSTDGKRYAYQSDTDAEARTGERLHVPLQTP
jgi:hypothetical protein